MSRLVQCRCRNRHNNNIREWAPQLRGIHSKARRSAPHPVTTSCREPARQLPAAEAPKSTCLLEDREMVLERQAEAWVMPMLRSSS